MPDAMRRPLGASLAASLLALAAAVPVAHAAGSSVDQLRQQQRELQRQRAAKAAQLDVQRASVRDVSRALDALEADLRSQRAVVTAARQRTEAQRARAAAAKAAAEQTAAELAVLRATVRRLAVEEYMRGGDPVVNLEGDAGSPMESVRRRSLLSAAVGRSSDVADQLRSTQEDHEVERRAAATAAEQAAAEQQRLESRLAELDAATEKQEALAAQVESRLEAQLAEADALASVDRRLAGQITAAQAELARRIAATPRRVAPGPARTVTPGPARNSGGISLSTVRGITVASSIAGNLARLLDAAEAAGIVLGGGGYRDSSAQIATRRANCGPTNYDIYEKPASQCSPPTARPGQSMHERGLAVDFTSGGGTVRSGSAAYRWLSANAPRFGFHNLPGEPWHWSTNGD
jgi:LAS superfamily LD-carboxypeptidase LdcB